MPIGRARCLGLPAWCCIACCEQGPAPNSTIPHLPVSVAGIAELAFASLVDLECAAVGEDTGCGAFRGRGAPPGLSDIADLVNKGCILNQPLADQGRTLIVTGLQRSGTSVVAAILHHAGVFIGNEINDAVYEDEAIGRVLLARDIGALRRIVAERNAAASTLGLQAPDAACGVDSRATVAVRQTTRDRHVPRSGVDGGADIAFGIPGSDASARRRRCTDRPTCCASSARCAVRTCC